VVFSFFKRKGDEPQTMTQPKAVAPKPQAGGASTQVGRAPEPAPADMELVEFEDLSYDGSGATAESHSAVEEAAILYANERVTEAVAALSGFITENASSRELHPWLLLFDLYQTQNMKQPFDELSMDFVVRFERSAPVWEGPRQAVSAAQAAPKSNAASSVQFKGQISATQVADIARMLKLAEADGGVKLDLAAAKGIDPDMAAELATALQSIRRSKKRITVTGANEFALAIKKSSECETRREKNCWALLFELYQVLGLQNEFEDAAVDYAVTFELSPPSWEALPETVQTAAVEPEAQETSAAPDLFNIAGVLSSSTDYQLRDLERYAESRTEIQIDMAGATRVDFVTVGAFINTLIMLNQKGKQVTISGANEMIHALFDVMGVTEYATVMRRKQR
jgi:anti-anti-sigma regulatory factor